MWKAEEEVSVDGRTFFRAVRPVCARFFSESLWLYTRGVHGQAAGCTLYDLLILVGLPSLIQRRQYGCLNKPLERLGYYTDQGP